MHKNLKEAIMKWNPESVAEALANGADAKAIDEGGTSMLTLATSFGNHKVIKLLVEKGADPNEADSSGLTPVMLAELNQRKDVVNLLEKLANAKDSQVQPVTREKPH